MRIVNSVLGDAHGGRWQVVCDYSRVLVQQGHAVVMLLHQRSPALAQQPAGVDVVRLRNHGHYDYPAAFRARRRLAQFKPQLAIAHCSRSVALLRRALDDRTPLLAVSHSNKVRRLLPADGYIALSSHIADAFARAAPAKPCYRIPNMIALPAGAGVPVRSCSTPLCIGALGRFDPVKGFDILIAALARLTQQGYRFTARLGGAGAELGKLEQQLHQAGLAQCVSLPGWVEDVPAFLAATDILVIPARADAFGLTPLQGAAAGVPMVLSMATGHRAMFEPEREALFAGVADVADTAWQIARLIDQPVLAETLAAAAFARTASEYSEAAVSPRLAQIIDKYELYR